MGRFAGWIEVHDPGFVRVRRGVRAVAATVLAWATMLAITITIDVADPLRITLFAAGAAFEGALLAADPQPRDRVQTLGWAAVVAAVTIIATVHLTHIAVWLGAALLVLLMFSSYALRGWNPRVANLMLIAAITVYVTGAGYITIGRIGWFAVAVAIGFGWLAVWEALILPDDPLGSLQRSVQSFSRRTAEAVTAVLDVLTAVRDGTPSDQARTVLHANLERVRSCRTAIDRQCPGVIARGVRQADADRLRVALYSAQKGLEDMAEHVAAPDWIRSLPDEVGWSIAEALQRLSDAVADDSGEPTRDRAAETAQVLRGQLQDALTQTATGGSTPFEPAALLAGLLLLGGGELTAQSVTQATTMAAELATVAGAAAIPAADPPAPADSHALSPTMALAIQAVVAAVTAALIAKAVGNEQSLVVAWTAFVIIAGSAGLSTRRALVRIPATLLGAVSGVVVAATVPDTVAWTVAVVAVGVFFTIFSAPVSYPVMVFWMSIAFVPLFATEGRYLDLVRDKGVAALIGGSVAALVALTVVPIRESREVRPTVLKYLAALDAALAAHLPGHEYDVAAADAALDSAYSALTTKVAAAASETNIFAQPERVRSGEAERVDAVHAAYQRLTPLLSESSRLLHGWSANRVALGIDRLRAAIERAESAPSVAGSTPSASDAPSSNDDAAANLGLSDSLRRVEELHAKLTDLAVVLGGLTRN